VFAKEDSERLTLGEQALVNETGDNVRVLEVVVVVRTKDVGRDGRSEVAAKLLVVSVVVDVYEALAVSVTKVGLVGRSLVDVRLVDGVGDLVGEDAGREAGDDLDAL
jgi:hypothetical protein